MRHAAFTMFVLIGLTSILVSETSSQTIDAGKWARFLEARHAYEVLCAPCHGLEEEAGLKPYAPSFGLGDGLDAEFGVLLAMVQEGTDKMPPWQGILSYEEQDWTLFYAISLQGDNVFRNKCASCHEGAAPRVPATIPRGVALDVYDGPIHLANGLDIARVWSQEEQVHVIRMLRTLAEEREPMRIQTTTAR